MGRAGGRDMEGMRGGYGAMAGGTGISDEGLTFPRTEAETIMIRKLDFTVEPDTTYRFRLRVVVRNPNLAHEDIAPGVDVSSPELFGPWSEPTDEVNMPADVTSYAVRKTPSADPGSEQVQFQVTRWNPEDGFTIVRTFDAAPGEIIGETRTAQVPATDGTAAKNKNIDFNSRQLVLDAMGGEQPIPAIPGLGGSRYEVPAVSLVVNPDGTVVVRNQARDLHDEVRKDTATNYTRELKESGQDREKKRRRRPKGPMMGGRGGGK